MLLLQFLFNMIRLTRISLLGTVTSTERANPLKNLFRLYMRTDVLPETYHRWNLEAGQR